jgi:hypothetical protein
VAKTTQQSVRRTRSRHAPEPVITSHPVERRPVATVVDVALIQRLRALSQNRVLESVEKEIEEIHRRILKIEGDRDEILKQVEARLYAQPNLAVTQAINLITGGQLWES